MWVSDLLPLHVCSGNQNQIARVVWQYSCLFSHLMFLLECFRNNNLYITSEIYDWKEKLSQTTWELEGDDSRAQWANVLLGLDSKWIIWWLRNDRQLKPLLQNLPKYSYLQGNLCIPIIDHSLIKELSIIF